MPEHSNPKLRQVPKAPILPGDETEGDYAELEVASNFSFLRGASHPDELVYRAAELGYRAIAITDVNSVAGVVRAHDAARQVMEQGGQSPKLIIGTRLCLENGLELLAWATDRAAYGRLCRLLTLGKRRAAKGECALGVGDFIQDCEGMLAGVVWGSDEATKRRSDEGEEMLRVLREALGNRLSLASSCVYGRDDAGQMARLIRLSRKSGIPLLATNNVHYHIPERRRLQDVLTCIRHVCTIQEAGFRLFPNGERYLKSPGQMRRLFADYPQAIGRGLEIAEQCMFSLDELRYEYPNELVPGGTSAVAYLADLAWRGAAERYPQGIPQKVRKLIEHELVLIEQLKYEAYFLTVHDLVTFARSRGILCQGRGSAANSAVCYCLGITSVDPARIDVLFGRFISAARNEPPDIDVDFEHERREEVIQYIYEKYGRERAGMTAEVITYRGRSAVRDVGKALGLSLDLVDQMAKKLDWWQRGILGEQQLRELGLDPNDSTIRLVVDLVGQLLGFPRHLSQHVGGMVMTRGPLCELVPIENASMENRTVIEWDKDDIDALGILKVDVLALGMLTCISKAFQLINEEIFATDAHRCTQIEMEELASPSSSVSICAPSVANQNPFSVSSVANFPRPRLELHTVPPEDPAVYDMISQADTIGVFQIESRAQMSMLPRLRPRCFYDLVIEVAIVRPGPIQGKMVHPYLRRRNGEEAVSYPSESLRNVLEKTLGVPLFQEQAMRVAMVGAGFSAEEADRLRRAMAAWRKHGAIDVFHQKILDGMLKNGYTREFAEQCFLQIRGFGEYGFPESHAASFALLVYVSAWLKRYHPAAFCASLLNSQPMGFYAPAQIVRDAREHGVEVRAVDVNHSQWDCTLEEKSATESTEDTEKRFATDEHRRTQIKAEKLASPLSSVSICAPSVAHLNSSSVSSVSSVVNKSTWGRSGSAVRLGFRLVKGLAIAHVKQLVSARHRFGPFTSIAHFHRTTLLRRHVLERLAEVDAFSSLGLSRREALWQVMELNDDDAPLFDHLDSSVPSSLCRSVAPSLPRMLLGQEVMIDYQTAGLSLKRHPVALVRTDLQAMNIISAEQIRQTPHGRWVRVAGLVLIRQRPGTASGIVFETLEDETGIINLIIRPNIYDKYRSAARSAGLLQAEGYVERQGDVIHVMVWRLKDLSHLLAGHQFTSRDFH